MDIRGKTAIITGASSGLGAAAAERLADAGANLLLVSNDKNKLDSVLEKLKPKTATTALIIDITNDSASREIVETALKKYGKVDILMSNAGIWTDNEIEDQQPSRIQEAFSVNAIAAIHLIKAVVPIMQKQGFGHILSTISTAGASDTEAGNNEDWMTYGATKWAMTGFMKALTKKLEATPIRTTAFMPGGFESDLYENAGSVGGGSDFHNQPWMMKTGDVADAVMFCLTRPADVQLEKIIITKKQNSLARE